MESLEQLRYPIGKMPNPVSFTQEEIQSWITNIEKLPKQLRDAVQNMLPEQLDTPYRPDGWTVRQVVHHIADSHMNAMVRLKLQPAVIFRSAGGQSETMAQARVGFKLDPKKNTIVKAGLGYRLGDAAQALLGVELGDLRVGASYDLTTSNLRSNTSIKDGFEIAIGYIGKIFKKPNPPATILCPKY